MLISCPNCKRKVSISAISNIELYVNYEIYKCPNCGYLITEEEVPEIKKNEQAKEAIRLARSKIYQSSPKSNHVGIFIGVIIVIFFILFALIPYNSNDKSSNLSPKSSDAINTYDYPKPPQISLEKKKQIYREYTTELGKYYYESNFNDMARKIGAIYMQKYNLTQAEFLVIIAEGTEKLW
jgi:DNA-directed RNA polymerase subunit RPC12/RpoP